MISIALLGAGRIGQIHGRNIAASKRAKLAVNNSHKYLHHPLWQNK